MEHSQSLSWQSHLFSFYFIPYVVQWGSAHYEVVSSMLLLWISSKILHFKTSAWLVIVNYFWNNLGITRYKRLYSKPNTQVNKISKHCSKNGNIRAQSSNQVTHFVWSAIYLMIIKAVELRRQLHFDHSPWISVLRRSINHYAHKVISLQCSTKKQIKGYFQFSSKRFLLELTLALLKLGSYTSQGQLLEG